jgi:hypothetical protein
MKKQTSIEWLIQSIVEDQTIKAKSMSEWNLVFEKVKQMYKEEVTDAYWDGGQDIPSHISTCENYYNETFGS